MWIENEPKYKELLPEAYANFLEIDILDSIIKDELQLLKNKWKQAITDHYVDNALDRGLQCFEDIYGLTLSDSMDILERRRRIKVWMESPIPFNEKWVENLCSRFFNTSIIFRRTADFSYSVLFEDGVRASIVGAFGERLRDLVPANVLISEGRKDPISAKHNQGAVLTTSTIITIVQQ